MVCSQPFLQRSAAQICRTHCSTALPAPADSHVQILVSLKQFVEVPLIVSNTLLQKEFSAVQTWPWMGSPLMWVMMSPACSPARAAGESVTTLQ